MRSIGKTPPTRPEEGLTPGFSQTYSISVVTPLFGGGFKAGEVDSEHPVRGTAIRGHLRFWWRATCGRKFSSSQELYHRESQIWGDTEKASPVRISVSLTNRGTLKSCAEISQLKDNRKNLGLGYVLFPFNVQSGQGLSGVSFELHLSGPEDLKEDIVASLRAWVCLGGLGARTRRGVGSLYCKGLSPEGSDLSGWMKKNLGDLVAEKSPWPLASRAILLGKTPKEPSQVWEDVAGIYRDFRQKEGVGRNPGQGGRPGRSRWPEADSIRRLLGTYSPKHVPDSSKPEESFPRAVFGLPIITHFKNERNEYPKDPEDSQLYPKIRGKKKDRMASPLIIKPLAISEDKAVPMIVVLNAPLPDSIVLEKGRDVWEGGMESVVDSRAASYPNSPMAGRSKTGDALEAFMAYAVKNHDFQEVSR